MKTFIRGICLIVILASFWTYRQWPDNDLHLIFCDVGQGDAALVIKGDFQMIIDTGPSPQKIISCLGRHLPFWDRRIELLISTHGDKDHIGGLAEVKKRFEIGREMGDGLIAGDAFRYSNLSFDILWPVERLASSKSNEVSVVGELTFGVLKALFTADIGKEQELALINSGLLEKVTLIKVPHHGSKYSSSQEFLEKIRPKEAVVSVGQKNSYGHPVAEILMRYDTLGSRLWRTDKNGEVEFVTDGKKYWVRAEK